MSRTTVIVSPVTERQVEALKARGYGSFTDIAKMAIDRMYREEFMNEQNAVKITKSDKPRCPVHGEQDTEYKAQDPAPCGCAWIWESGKLISVPSRKDFFK